MVATLLITVLGEDLGIDWPPDVVAELLAYGLEEGEFTELDPDMIARLCQFDNMFCSNTWYVMMSANGMNLYNDVYFSELNKY